MRATPAKLTLTDAYDTIVIRPAAATAGDPIYCTSWDLGAPEVRISSSNRSGADGTYDGAGFTGARTVTFDLKIVGGDGGTPYNYLERLAAMTHPWRRPTLKIVRPTIDTGGDEWTMELRGNPFSTTFSRRSAALIELQLTFNAPLGYLEGPLRSHTSSAATAVSSTGFSLPVSLPFDLGTGAGSNPALNFTVEGSAPVAPVIAVYGPIANPKIQDGNGNTFLFKGLTLGAGEFVAIDMDAATVRLNGSVDASVYHLVDFSASTFWRWNPGAHTVTHIASSGNIQVQYRERRFTM